MAPTIEVPAIRIYHVRLDGGESVAFPADTVCEPGKGRTHFVFKRNGNVVAKFRDNAVLGWYITEAPAD